jgi:HSP20 family protein
MAIVPYRSATDLPSPFDALLGSFGASRMGDLLRTPSADIVENENQIEVRLETPGMRPDDIEINLENNVLTVSGEKKFEHEEGEAEGTFHLSERHYGRFSRSFVLPRDVEAEQIQARCENGVLRITVPKSERAKRRRIEIRGENGEV